jgi:hypothetical protein
VVSFSRYPQWNKPSSKTLGGHWHRVFETVTIVLTCKCELGVLIEFLCDYLDICKSLEIKNYLNSFSSVPGGSQEYPGCGTPDSTGRNLALE